ncbi:GNAT family N-acetyltransferase [Paracoccus aestuariivivens]|uniref:GNAT family N-acetyltransferase n=1 Tax=Paracoccus aestuariivivens TaxID=1820333 RepID=A0A6L6JA56_9RHOB|nr:GNAT family N-acetyltransferase [Paracoccus aestuariivivens]MTH78436.1 GNAT family N-acetyltransferase [Paracoccus aestuariivivens]
MTQTLTFQPFGPEHLDGALRLSEQARWPHRRDDWALVAAISKGVVALEDDRIVATALATPFGDAAMANMIIVDESMRGRGLGREIMLRAMDCATPGQWRLVATQSGLPLYEKLGFSACGMVHQRQGHLLADCVATQARPALAADLDAIRQMDREATQADRSGLIDLLAARGQLAIIEGKGYAAIRPFGRGHVVGPVIADDAETARDLLSQLFAGRRGAFLRVDTADLTGLEDWLAGLGLVEVDRGIAMRRGGLPENKGRFMRFALAAQALG